MNHPEITLILARAANGVIGADGKEEMANTRVSGDYTVADFIAEKFILRYGKTQAEVTNKTWSKRPKPQGCTPRASTTKCLSSPRPAALRLGVGCRRATGTVVAKRRSS